MGRALIQCVKAAATLGFIGPGWRPVCWMALGAALGLGAVVAHVSRAASYLGDEPETCVNCHVMNPPYATWQRSSHANVATCNDCHVPHDSVLSHYAFKARNGLYHSTILTLHLEPQVIELSAGAVPVVEANCRRCHEQVVGELHLAEFDPTSPRCWQCHREVPHGQVHSLSATPRVMNPQLPGVVSPRGRMTIGGRAPRADKGGAR